MEKNTLYVDLDGTLIFTDLLYESFILLLKTKPLYALIAIFYIFKGKHTLKCFIARNVELNVKNLPFNQELLLFLRNNKTRWNRIILATASHEKYAIEVVKHFYDVFDASIATNEHRNLKSSVKLQEIQRNTIIFDYVGDSNADRVIFQKADALFLVSSNHDNFSEFSFEKIFYRPTLTFKAMLKQIRIHQWSKNFLILVPLLTSGLFVNFCSIYYSIIGFFSFSLLASSTYIINDVLDLESDRQHPNKSKRPIASGTLSIPAASLLSALLFLSSIILALTINLNFILVLIVYLFLTILSEGSPQICTP